MCVAVTDAQGDSQDGEVRCLSGRDLSSYDYVSVGKDGSIPVSVKPTSVSRLENVEF